VAEPPLARCCDTLCTSGFVNDVMFAYNGPHAGGRPVDTAAASGANAPAVSYWLRRVLDDSGCRLPRLDEFIVQL